MTSSVMEALVLFVVLVVTMTGSSDGGWCVCRQDMSDSALQKTIDYACGAGADCSPINQNGVCFNPNTVKSHCSYAANSYYQRKGQNPQACNFAGTAALTQQDPSSNGCTYPAASSAAAGTSTGNNNGAGMGTGNGASPVTGSGAGAGAGAAAGNGNGAFPTPVGTNPASSTTPSTTTPTSSGTGGVMAGGGLGPSANVISTDNNSRRLIPMTDFGSLLHLILSALVFFRA